MTKESNSLPSIPAEKDNSEMEKDIDKFKTLAIKEAVRFMEHDVEFAEVKQFKDMVAIVDSIEKSYRANGPEGPTINVVIQQLVQRFKEAPDDC